MTWFSFAPIVIVFGTVALLFTPYLVLIALPFVFLALLAALMAAVVAIPYALIHSISRRWKKRSEAGRPRAVLN